ncbi:hypothetical protein Sjap_018554 [Stephania japonica]|uniref:J domain-containing protein n=1 Tax=Stephania japonica TaxID=461633 RepID=A0AAP0I862_9MAGN
MARMRKHVKKKEEKLRPPSVFLDPSEPTLVMRSTSKKFAQNSLQTSPPSISIDSHFCVVVCSSNPSQFSGNSFGGEMRARGLGSVLTLRNSICPSSRFSSFHSTPACSAKWKAKWDSDIGRGQQPSKSYVRYATRQKRADAKKALKDLLYASGSYKPTFQDKDSIWGADPISGCSEDKADKKSHSKKSSGKASASHSSGGKRHYNEGNRKPRRGNFSFDDEEDSEVVFQTTFESRCYTWSFKSWEDSNLRHSSSGFEWRDQSNWTNNRRRTWNSASETDEDEKSYVVGSLSDRALLGLPTSGPLKIEDVKSAFRSSAMKWHPDKHQGPSQQSKAEERFKQCVNAYKSLCSALSSS